MRICSKGLAMERGRGGGTPSIQSIRSTESRESLIARANSLTTGGHITETTPIMGTTPTVITLSLTRPPGAALTGSRTTLRRFAAVHHHHIAASRTIHLRRRLLRLAALLITGVLNTHRRRRHRQTIHLIADHRLGSLGMTIDTQGQRTMATHLPPTPKTMVFRPLHLTATRGVHHSTTAHRGTAFHYT